MSFPQASVARRLVLGAAATVSGPLGTIAIQLASVPIFLHFWGTALYGEWLIMIAIPSYLTLGDFGFGSVAGNDMTMSVAAEQHDEALRTFQTT